MKRSQGFTIVELLVVMLIMGLLTAAVFSMVTSSARLHRVDQQRADDDRTLRGALDLISADVREAGERLPEIVPAVQVFKQGDNDAMILLRGLSDTYLPLCSPIASATADVYVTGTTSSTLNPFDTKFSDGSRVLPDACGATSGAALAWAGVLNDMQSRGEGESVSGVIIDAVGKRMGDFTFLGLAQNNGNLIRLSGVTLVADPRRASTTSAAQDYRLYLVEKRTYWLQNKALYLSRNGADGVIAMPGAQALTITPMQAGTAAALPFGKLLTSPTWRQLSEVQLSLSRQAGTVTRQLNDSILPRNAMSKDQ